MTRNMLGAGIALALVAATPALGSHDVPRLADRTVCQKHTANTKVTKAQCLGRWRTLVMRQDRRDRAYWPKYPVTTRDLKVRHVPIASFARLARCEAGYGSEYGGARWTTPRGWTYQGGLGMWLPHLTAGHPYGTDVGPLNWQTQMLVGERVRLQYGLSAWEAYRNNPGPCWYG